MFSIGDKVIVSSIGGILKGIISKSSIVDGNVYYMITINGFQFWESERIIKLDLEIIRDKKINEILK
jgi:hypothetical protein